MKNIYKITLSGLFIALGLIFPFLTGQIPEIGNMLLPMHIPVLICGFICGWQYGLIVGFITPLLRSVIFTMPPLFPTATAMAFELAVYGLMTGLLYKIFPKRNIYVYISLILSMVTGRLVWGAVSIPIYALDQSAFAWKIFINGALLNAIPGIILQLVLIPPIIILLRKSKLMPE